MPDHFGCESLASFVGQWWHLPSCWPGSLHPHGFLHTCPRWPLLAVPSHPTFCLSSLPPSLSSLMPFPTPSSPRTHSCCMSKLTMMDHSSKCSQTTCCGIIGTAVSVRGNVNVLIYYPFRRSAEAGSKGTAYIIQWLIKDELTLARKLSSYIWV